MRNIATYIAHRLAEPSTYRGLIGLLTAAGVAISPDMAEKIIAVGMFLIGLINIGKKDANSPDATK